VTVVITPQVRDDGKDELMIGMRRVGMITMRQCWIQGLARGQGQGHFLKDNNTGLQ